MSRKKKTPPAERREQERLRRISAPEEKEKRKAAIEEAKAKAAEARAKQQAEAEKQIDTDPAPDIGSKQDPEPAPDAGQAPPAAPSPAAMPCMGGYSRTGLQFIDAGDAGADCRNYQIKFPSRMDIRGLFDAIRKDQPEGHGTVYISTNLAEAGPGNYQLSYSYADHLFTRREKPSRNKKFPALADLLGSPITKLRAAGGWGAMDYFVNIYASEIQSGEESGDSHGES